MEYSTAIGIIVVLTGLFEIFVTPVLIKRFGGRLPPARFDQVVRMARASGLIVVIIGLFLLFGLRRGLS